MEPWSLVLVIAMFSSLPAAVILVGILAQRPVSGEWMRRHARGFSWLAGIGWGATALRHWLAPGGELSTLMFVASIGAMICTVGYAVIQPGLGSSRP